MWFFHIWGSGWQVFDQIFILKHPQICLSSLKLYPWVDFNYLVSLMFIKDAMDHLRYPRLMNLAILAKFRSFFAKIWPFSGSEGAKIHQKRSISVQIHFLWVAIAISSHLGVNREQFMAWTKIFPSKLRFSGSRTVIRQFFGVQLAKNGRISKIFFLNVS